MGERVCDGYIAFVRLSRTTDEVTMQVGSLFVEPTTLWFLLSGALFGSLGTGATAAAWRPRGASWVRVAVFTLLGGVTTFAGILAAATITDVMGAVLGSVPVIGYSAVVVAPAPGGGFAGALAGAVVEASRST